jgi:hypothetical protein
MADGPTASTAAIAAPEGSQAVQDLIEALRSDLLMVYRAVVALEKRVNESTVNMVEIKPQLIALKVHMESFPNALREMRRYQTATQKAIFEFDARLRSVESRVKGTSAPPAT